MSANRSVDRSAVAHEKDRSAVAHEKGRSAVAHEKGRSAVAREKDRSAVAHEKGRSGLCSFTFADGRQCRTPRHAGHPYLCAFHARKEAQALDGEAAGKDIAYHLSGTYVSACDLTSALGRLFSAVAQGQVKPKTASTLAYLGQTLVQTLHLAQHEYINAYGTDSWRETIRTSHELSADRMSPDPPSPDPPSPDPEPAPAPTPAAPLDASPASE
jgi:hypothetical protein